MIKEMALSTWNRHHFIEESKVSDWQNVPKDTFISLYDYDEHIREYFQEHKKLAGYDGLIYMPDEFLLDVDGTDPKNAQQKTIGLLVLLQDLLIPFNVYFSGTGFHVGIPSTAFRWKPDKNLHIKVKQALTHAGIFEYADHTVTDKTRIIRLNNTRNSKSGKWKICIKPGSIYNDINDILEQAKTSSTFQPELPECEPVFDVFTETKTEEKAFVDATKLGRKPDPINYPCIQTMIDGADKGNRHAAALRVTAHLRWVYPEVVVRAVMENWRQRVSNEKNPFAVKEMDSIIENCYSGHGGKGYRYGCHDVLMDKHCKDTCRLYKAKAGNLMMKADDMEKTLIDFYTKDLKGINLGEPYGQNFPIYPGEVVIIQAPPKAMKTMLLQNWVNYFKKPTYFMEMEMSPRQMWSRFVQIEKGWSEEQLKEHYRAMRNGISEGFDWLTMDYSACYPFEIQRRLAMLPTIPEIVIIDHMGLLRSKKQDNNMKVEEASQALMELAVQQNLIVFAVSEITKSAFNEGMNLASAKGSFRIAYNANKVISINPSKGSDGLISQLHIKSEANREREVLDTRVWVNGVKITGEDKGAYEQVTS